MCLAQNIINTRDASNGVMVHTVHTGVVQVMQSLLSCTELHEVRVKLFTSAVTSSIYRGLAGL